MAGTTKPTVYKWVKRYEEHGIDGLTGRKSTGRPPEVSAEVRSRIVALTRKSPPEKTGLSQWSSREMARYLEREEGISVSHNFVAELWWEHDLRPHQQGTFKLETGFAQVLLVRQVPYPSPSQGVVLPNTPLYRFK